MQNTLLGLGIVLILAIVSALVAPLVIDWNHYRGAIEAEASRLTGFDVRINGTIEARLLPSPALTLHEVAIGPVAREPQLHASTLKLEVVLGSLLRGQVEASSVHLIGAQLSLGLDRSGAIRWPATSPSFRPQSLSISHFNIENGRVILTDAASGSQLILQSVWFNGNISSFFGPFDGQGTVAVRDETYRYRISGRLLDGAARIKIGLGVDPANRPLSTDFDGMLTFDGGVPQFKGTMALARPVGAALANGRRVVNSPWHAAGTLQLTPASASIRHVAFRYGPEERALNFTGSAELTFGAHPHLRADISALHVDVDRALAAPDVTNRAPLVMIKSFLQAFAAAAKLPIPAQIGVDIDALTVGGATIESLRCQLHFNQTGWRVDDFQFRAPGMTDVNVSGRLMATADGFAFNGPVAMHSADVDSLMAWLNGRSSNTPSGEAKTMSARGEVTMAGDRVAVEQLTATLAHEKVEGQLAYDWPTVDRPARFDAKLRASELNLDGLVAFSRAAVRSGGWTPPREATLALDIGKATFVGVQAQAINAQIEFDAGKLQIDRLSVGDLGGATLALSGRIDELSSQPRGQLTLDVNAWSLDGLRDIAAKLAPQAASRLPRAADRLAPAKIHAALTVARGPNMHSIAQLHVNGSLAAMRVAIDGQASGNPSDLEDAVLQFDSRVDADDGSALVALLGLDRIVAVDQLPAQLLLSGGGTLNRDVRLDGKLSASGFDSAIGGVLRFNDRRLPVGTLRVMAAAGDLRPFHQAMSGEPGAAVPVSLSAALAVNGTSLSFSDITATVGKTSVKGRLELNLTNPIGIGGHIEADGVDAASAMATLLGLPNAGRSAGQPWSSETIGPGGFGTLNGTVTFTLNRAALTTSLTPRDLKGAVHFRQSEIDLTNIDGRLAGGRVVGGLAFRRDPNGLAVHVRLKIIGAAAATILGPSLSVAGGALSATLQCDGFGATPIALIGSLHGNSAMTLTDARFAGIDIAAFDAAIQAAGQSGSIEMAKVQAAVTSGLAKGWIAIPQGDAEVTIASGAVNLNRLILPAQGGAELSLDGMIDLAKFAIDARMTLSEPPPANALIHTRPELSVIVKGPMTAPERRLDISALASWLTLTTAELQTRRLELIESNQRLGAASSDVNATSPGVHIVPPGALVESVTAPNLPVAPSSDATGLQRLPQSSAPVVVP